jgi:membrane protease YdiL (CAAX protease family)
MRNVNRWLYRGGRPNRIARWVNRLWAAIASLGVAPNYMETLEVTGRRSGRVVSLPVVIAIVAGERYLVSMLGDDVNWIHNVRAAGGRAALRSAGVEHIRLEDVPVERRAPIVKEYLRRAPGGRPHIPVDKDAPLAEFERIAHAFPVFRVVSESAPTASFGRAPGTFVAVTFLLSLPLWIVGAATGRTILAGLPVSALMAFCPALAASLLVYRRGGGTSVVALLRRSFDIARMGRSMAYAPMLLLLPGVLAATGFVANALGRSWTAAWVPLPQLTVTFVAFFVAALGEELGWSGYAIEPMQARWGAWRASLQLGAVWALWHLVPLLQMGRAWSWIGGWVVYTVALRVVLVWLYDRANRSVCATAVTHAIANVCSLTFAGFYDPTITGLVLALAAILLMIAWPVRAGVVLRR